MRKNLDSQNNSKEKKKSKKLKIFLIIFLIIIIPFLIFFIYRFVSNKLDEVNTKKINNAIKDVNKEKISYVFIEINPSLVVTIKNNQVKDVSCLNNDCMKIYNDLDIKGKNLNDSIELVYNLSKQNGFDTSNGVKVSSTDNITIEKKDYINFENIGANKEKELLNEIKNNNDIVNVSNNDYYTKLWEELKKDSNYDNVYSCKMNNNELECYINLDTGINKDSDYDVSIKDGLLDDLFTNSSNKILNTLKKFDFDVRDKKVYINNIEFGYIPLFTANGTPYKNALTAKIIDSLDAEVCTYVDNAKVVNGKCLIENGFYIIPLGKINLVNPASIIDNMITFKLGISDNALQQYEINKMLNE